MSMAFIVWIASISSSVHTVGYCIASAYLVVSWFTLMVIVLNSWSKCAGESKY